MGEVISYLPRKVKAQGLRRNQEPSPEKLRKYLFAREQNTLPLLRQLPQFPRQSVKILYPGAGVDILFPLFYLEHLFPSLEKAELVMVDRSSNQEMIETILDDLGISFAAGRALQFYWKNMLVAVSFIEGDIFHLLPRLPSYDVYFERAFRIIREGKEGYEELVVSKLNSGGILLSDSGFENMRQLKYFPVPKELSAYGEMVVGVKEGNGEFGHRKA